MFILFCIAQVIAGFMLFIFGAGMIDHPDLAVVLIGAMLSMVGFLVAVMFTLLIDKKLKGDMF